jgi:hypothetical protein
VGAALDLQGVPALYEQIYGEKPLRRNLHNYFIKSVLPNIVVPSRRYFTTNDPVMTPELLDHFFNRRTQVFTQLDVRKKQLLHAIYDLPTFQSALPAIADVALQQVQRTHQRFSVKCPGKLNLLVSGKHQTYPLMVAELSLYGFQVFSRTPLPLDVWGEAIIELGQSEKSIMKVMGVREDANRFHGFYAFKVAEPDLSWRKFVNAMQSGTTHEDLDNATRFLPDATHPQGQSA